ncbi:olfactory receptor 11L1-like [Pelodytes ibericus]
MNQTTVTEFILLGIPNLQTFKIFFFFLLLIFYCVTMSGNRIIICLVAFSRSLHTPMYFFLTQLSISDILLTTNIVPNTLCMVLNDGVTMSFAGCITQFFFFSGTESLECVLLTVMAYDRYLAISNPLRYSSLMTSRICIKLIIASWLFSSSVILLDIVTISGLHFCGPNIIDHLFCDLPPLLKLSCSDISIVQAEVFIMCVLVVIIPFMIITVSYVYIVNAVLRISSTRGRQKAFLPTCSSHLAVVCIFYGALTIIYMLPTKGKTLTISKVLTLLYTVVTPMFNPMIYSLRNKDIKEAMKNMFLKWIHNI